MRELGRLNIYWRGACALMLAVMVSASTASAENWPQFRGPRGDGTSAETEVPTRLDKGSNLLWSAPLDGPASSSPIVWGERVFVTVQIGRGPKSGDWRPAAGQSQIPPAMGNEGAYDLHFLTLCYDAATGRELWRRRYDPDQLTATHSLHNLASPSPVTDGERVYIWYASGMVFCFAMDGEALWERDIASETGPFLIKWGHGGSPALYENSLILSLDHTDSPAYILGVDKLTGKTLWKSDRGLGERGYSTPYLYNDGERDHMLLNTKNAMSSYDPATGEFAWTAGGLQRVMVSMPVYSEGVIYSSGGYRNAPYMAVRPGGSGDVTESHVIWRKNNGAPYIGSIVVVGSEIYMADTGVVKCVDTATGEVIWKERVGAGPFAASPVVAGGNIYVIDEEGDGAVFRAGREYDPISEIHMGERTFGTPAISGGRIYVRTDQNLYCFGAGR